MLAELVLSGLALASMPSVPHQFARSTAVAESIEVSGAVRDSGSGRPVAGAIVRASRASSAVVEAVADSAGRYVLHLCCSGAYVLSARQIGYQPAIRRVVVEPARRAIIVDFYLLATATEVRGLTVTTAPVEINVRSGDQSYRVHDAHSAPSTTTSQLIQQAIAGAARAPTGEVHIRGQHAEYTYYVDGVPVPAGISGSLNELFDPVVADRIDFETGGWDAEYGDKNIAIVNVRTRVPGAGLHVEASADAGSFATAGQTLVASGMLGPLGILLSGTHRETGMRREPLMQDPGTGAALNFHNHGEDTFGFGKVQYAPSDHDSVTLDANVSGTSFEVPFDSTGGNLLDDHQRDVNGFANLGWRHRFRDPMRSAAPGQDLERELFAAFYFRWGGLTYTPGAVDRPQFVFYPDTTRRYTVNEHRTAATLGVKAEYTVPLSYALQLKTGLEASLVTGREDFDTRDSLGGGGPSEHSGLHGGDVGLFAQGVLAPSPRWELRTGVRLDYHMAPLAGDIHQVSPRIRLAWFPDSASSVWGYYGRLFIPANVEDLHLIASAAQGGAIGTPTVPERDHYFEIGATHRFPGGVATKLAGYYRDNGPAIDDNTLPGTAVTTTVNIARVHVAGIEGVVEVHPAGPLSGYLNAALSHASAHGPITGGFFPTPYPAGWFDQDHDQRLSIVASGSYDLHRAYVSLTGIYGSGLTNGHPEAAPNETGLFDFNPGIKVKPSVIMNASVGTWWAFGATAMRVECFVDNLFDRRYVLKGAFTSGPSIGRPRSIDVRVRVGG